MFCKSNKLWSRVFMVTLTSLLQPSISNFPTITLDRTFLSITRITKCKARFTLTLMIRFLLPWGWILLILMTPQPFLQHHPQDKLYTSAHQYVVCSLQHFCSGRCNEHCNLCRLLIVIHILCFFPTFYITVTVTVPAAYWMSTLRVREYIQLSERTPATTSNQPSQPPG